jgi:hypothetical protein
MRFFLPSLVLMLGSIEAFAAGPPILTDNSVRWQIERLGSDSWMERNTATEALKKLEAVPHELRIAANSADPEVRRRARWVIDAIVNAPRRTALEEIPALAKEGAIDQVIDRLVRYADEDPSGGEIWALIGPTKRFVQAMRLKHDVVYMLNTFEKNCPFNARQTRAPLTFTHSDDPPNFFVLTGDGVKVQGPGCGGLIASGAETILSAEVKSHVIIFSNGDVTLKAADQCLLIICDGDVHIEGPTLMNSIIVARGNVCLPHSISYTTVFAGGKIYNSPHPPLAPKVFLYPNGTKPPGGIKFFDTASAGIEVVSTRRGVKVDEIDAKKGFAGIVHEGDLVLAVNQVNVSTAEDFRKALRRALAEGTRSIGISLKRGGKNVDLRVRVRP